jgi:hypothetical protein
MSDPSAPVPYDFRHVLSVSFKTVARHWRTCLLVAAPYVALTVLTNVATGTSTGLLDPTTVSPRQVLAAGIIAVVVFFGLLLINVLIAPITLGALSQLGSAAAFEDVVDRAGLIKRALDRAADVVGAALLAALIVIAGPLAIGVLGLMAAVLISGPVGFAVMVFGFFIVVLPVLYVAVRLSLVIPVVMREGRGPIDALRRSWELVGHVWWWVFTIDVVLAVVVFVLQAALSYVARAVDGSVLDPIVGALSAGIVAAVWITLFGVASGVVYACRAPENVLPPDVAASEARIEGWPQTQ